MLSTSEEARIAAFAQMRAAKLRPHDALTRFRSVHQARVAQALPGELLHASSAAHATARPGEADRERPADAFVHRHRGKSEVQRVAHLAAVFADEHLLQWFTIHAVGKLHGPSFNTEATRLKLQVSSSKWRVFET